MLRWCHTPLWLRMVCLFMTSISPITAVGQGLSPDESRAISELIVRSVQAADTAALEMQRGGDQPEPVGGTRLGAGLGAGLTAARVEIRFERELVGVGEAVIDQTVVTPDQLGVARKATQQAIESWKLASRGMTEGLDAAGLEKLAGSLAVSVELAGAWVPLTEAELHAVDIHMHRGIEGVAARALGRVAVSFPSRLHGHEPAQRSYTQELSNLAAKVLEDPEASVESATLLAQRRGVLFYRFTSAHQAQVSPGGPLRSMHRGGRLVYEDEVRPEWLQGLAAATVGHLSERVGVSVGPGGEFGDQAFEISTGPIEILSGASTPSSGRAWEVELSLLALQRAQQSAVLPTTLRETASQAHQALWDHAASKWNGRRILPQNAALLWLGRPMGEDHAEFRAAIEDSLNSLLEQLATVPWEGTPQEAVALWALAEQHAGSEHAQAVSSALGAMLAVRGPGGAVGLLPWAAFADAALHPAEGVHMQVLPGADNNDQLAVETTHAGQMLQAGPMFRQVRAAMWHNQFTSQDAEAPTRDMIGGVIFTSGGSVLPTSTTLRPLAYAAWGIADRRLTTQQELLEGELVKVLRGMRFAGQLMVTEAELYASSQHERVVGGVRRTLWDDCVRMEDTAMALLCSIELLESLAKLSAE